MHRHQAIVPFLLYDTTTKSRGLQLHITELRHFTTATPLRVTRYVDIYSADRTCCCQSPFPSLQLLAALTASGKLWCSNAAYIAITMNFTAEQVFLTLFVWSCCLLLFYELDLSFSHLLVSVFCAYKLLYPCTT